MCEDTPVSVQGCGQSGASLLVWSLVPRELTRLVLVWGCGPQVPPSPPALGSPEVAGLAREVQMTQRVDPVWPSPLGCVLSSLWGWLLTVALGQPPCWAPVGGSLG